MSLFNLVITLVFVTLVTAATQLNPVVRVAHGLLRGSWKVSEHGRSYASFEGIPYAQPPEGELRFRDPQQLKPWSDVRDAGKILEGCLQYEPFKKKIIGSENCLFLNVYSSHLDKGATLPVVIYIHGGAFMYGSGSQARPDYILDRDVVLVTLNYRLGPLGFLSTGDEVVSGNAGLKDQAFALKWIQENIHAFGGDPKSVTLTGLSAGGASVHYHYLSPLSKGTFHRGIAMSGTAFSSWAHATKPVQKAKTLANIVGCPTGNNHDMVECLRKSPGETVVNAQIEMFSWKVHMFTPFVPTVEPSNTKNPFLTQYPYHASQAGALHKVPLITSATSEEGLYPAAVYQSDPNFLNELEERWNELASNIFEYNDTLPVNLHATVAQKIKQQYLKGNPVSQESFPELVQALGDRHFVEDVGKLAQIHAEKSSQPVYVYHYSFRGEKSLSQLMAGNNNNYGVSHADDLFHILKYDFAVSKSPEDMKMTEDLLDMVYSYATIGVPKFNNAAWKPVTPRSSDLNYLEISAPGKAEMKSSSDFGHRSFWDSLGFIENEKFETHIRDEFK